MGRLAIPLADDLPTPLASTDFDQIDATVVDGTVREIVRGVRLRHISAARNDAIAPGSLFDVAMVSMHSLLHGPEDGVIVQCNVFVAVSGAFDPAVHLPAAVLKATACTEPVGSTAANNFTPRWVF
jgi:hypothetical protein